ncbi:MAG TPA: PAS domain-containing protein, partial [Edaphobacter sp.]|nr:PAS domain-containing protein [Edaphobacter sp.]
MPNSATDKTIPWSERRTLLRREEDLEHDYLAKLLGRIPDAILCINRDWHITYANAEAIRISRVRPELFDNAIFWNLFPGLAGTEIENRCRASMDSGTPDNFEFFYQPFDLWVDIHIFPTEEGLALYYRDISTHKRAEALRDASTRQLHQVFEATTDSIVCIDRNWICTFANRAAYEILKTDNLVGENLWTRYPTNQQEPFASNYLATMEQRIPTEFEAYYPAPLDIWFKVFARPYEDGIIIFSSDITDRKGAEFLRAASERQLRHVLEATSDAIVSINRDWKITFLNPRAKELLSPKGDLLGKNMWEEFPVPSQPHHLIDHFYRAMDQSIAGEFEAFTPAPLNLWLSIQCRPSDGGIVVFFRDITARRQSDDVVQHQQDLLSVVQQTARAATWDVDLATGKINYGIGSYPVFGHPLDHIPDLDAFRGITAPAFISGIDESIQRAIATGKSIVVEAPVLAASGEQIWLEHRGQAVRVDGVPTRLRGMTIDVTSRKKNEEALVASEARYRVLAELNPQGIWMGSPDGDITYANQAFLDYIGLTIETIGDGGWLNAFHPDDRKRVLEAWSHSISTGVDYDVEARMIRALDGRS